MLGAVSKLTVAPSSAPRSAANAPDADAPTVTVTAGSFHDAVGPREGEHVGLSRACGINAITAAAAAAAARVGRRARQGVDLELRAISKRVSRRRSGVGLERRLIRDIQDHVARSNCCGGMASCCCSSATLCSSSSNVRTLVHGRRSSSDRRYATSASTAPAAKTQADANDL